MLEFGPFQLDLEQRLLLRDGKPAPLSPKAVLILCVLAETPGKLVERDEIMRRVWPDTHVEEGNLSVNIFALRKALAEGLDGTPAIETIPRRGYRFVAPLGRPPAEAAPGPVTPAAPIGEAPAKPVRWHRILWTTAAALAAAILGGAILARGPNLRVGRVSQLTHLGLAQDVVTDGERLYFAQQIGSRTTLAHVAITGGDPVAIPTPVDDAHILDVSASRGELLVRGRVGPHGAERVWILPLRGGSPRPLGQIDAGSARWSPDGSRLAYQLDDSLYSAAADGTGIRKLTDRGGIVDGWSPDGQVVRFTRTDEATGGQSIWEVRADGSALRPFLPQRRDRNARWMEGQCCGRWTDDGDYFLFREASGSDFSLWAAPERSGFFAWGWPQPVKLYSAGFDFSSLAVSPDGKRVFLASRNESRELVRYAADLRQWVPVLAGLPASGIRWSPDGNWIAYTTFPDMCLWRARADGSERLQLTFPPAETLTPVWSPDGENIVFISRLRGGHWNIMTIPRSGGIASPLMPGDQDQANPSWSPDGRTLAFAGAPWVQAFAPHSTAIHLLDVASRRITTLPDSDGLWSPRWSPNGKYIVAETLDARGLMLFDVPSRRWIKIASLGDPAIGYTAWSSDSRFVYYNAYTSGADEIHRVNVSTLAAERVIVIDNLDEPEPLGRWFTLSPDNSPLLLRDTSIREIYALTLQY